MEKQAFEAVLLLLVPQIVERIANAYGWDELAAHREFYDSSLYALLEQEETKLWHLSAQALFALFDEERRTGRITFPEEA